MIPEIIKIEVSKSKKDNIHCLYLKLNSKHFGIENHTYDIDYYEEGQSVTLELYLGDCELDEYLGRVNLDISKIWDKYEFPHYDIHKNKEEVYIYFYEYPYEEDDVEWLDIKIEQSGFIPRIKNKGD